MLFSTDDIPITIAKRSSRKLKLRELQTVYIYDAEIVLRALDEYDLQDSFQKHINPGSRELSARNTTVLRA